jgi:3-phosphoshikimate 1-carboxyvinyltransferase
MSGNPTSTRVDYLARGGGPLCGRLRVPGDKSISHRAIMLGSIATGRTEVSGFLEGEDSLATVAAFRAMGVRIDGPHDGRVSIEGVGLHGLRAPAAALDLGNSGTSMRLLSGLLAGQPFSTRLTGDESLSRRPMARVIAPLQRMGAHIESSAGGKPPLDIRGSNALHGIDYVMPVASAQVKSALLLAGLYASGDTSVTEPAPTRDHTERMLAGFGCTVRRDGARVTLRSGGELHGAPIDVPGDISSAAFFLVAASISPGSDLLLEHVGVNPTRIGVVNILRAMGASIDVLAEREVGGEPVANLRVRAAELRGIEIPLAQVPLAIDEFPVLFIAAACARGATTLHGAEELRVKESDRIEAMARGLAALGVAHEVFADGIRIQGGAMSGGMIDSRGDHRIAMAFAVASLRSSAPIEIRDCANVATSFPRFRECAEMAGLHIEQRCAADRE